MSLVLTFEREEDLNAVFARFKELADKKHEVYDDDLHALVSDTFQDSAQERIKLIAMKVAIETGETPKALVTISFDGKEQQAEAVGGGPVDATFKAIESMVVSGCTLQLYSVNNITTGTDSQGEVTVRIKKNSRVLNGQGADTDIVIASAKAYINALNKALDTVERAHPQV